MRDPAAVVGHGYNINFMATWAREREPLILSYVFRHHPRLRHLKESDRLFDQITPLLKGEIRLPQSLEGGDTLVLSDRVLAVGCSERTSADAIHMLAESLRQAYHRGESTFDTLLMVLMPKIRSAMHLDTIFTRISQDECLIYPPFFTDHSRELLNVVKFDLRHNSCTPSWSRTCCRRCRARASTSSRSAAAARTPSSAHSGGYNCRASLLHELGRQGGGFFQSILDSCPEIF